MALRAVVAICVQTWFARGGSHLLARATRCLNKIQEIVGIPVVTYKGGTGHAPGCQPYLESALMAGLNHPQVRSTKSVARVKGHRYHLIKYGQSRRLSNFKNTEIPRRNEEEMKKK